MSSEIWHQMSYSLEPLLLGTLPLWISNVVFNIISHSDKYYKPSKAIEYKMHNMDKVLLRYMQRSMHSLFINKYYSTHIFYGELENIIPELHESPNTLQ